MRPIDADELEKFLYWDNDIEAWYLDGKDLDDFSTINPEDLRPKGKWDYYSTTMQECSVCKRHTPRHRYEFCPRCGAKMEE